MSRSFLTGLNLNKNELLNARIQNLATPPSNPVSGQIYYDTDTNQLTVWDGTAWVSLAAGGNVTEAINAAIDALTTDAIEEGSTNLYFTTERAQDAVGNSVGNGIVYNDTSGAISVNAATSGGITVNAAGVSVNRTTVDTWYDAAGAASTVAGDLSTHISDTTTHGVTGDIVGTSDAQTLSNKTFSTAISFNSGGGVAGSLGEDGSANLRLASTTYDLELHAGQNIQLTTTNADIVLNADGNSYIGSTSAGNEIATRGYVTNRIGDVTVDGSTGNTITDRITSAVNALDTDAIEEGSTNLYFTAERAQDAVGNNVGTGLVYDDANAAISVNTSVIATKTYVDGLVQGLNVKETVKLATTESITLSGTSQTIDGFPIYEGDRILVKNNGSQNGIYVVASGSWSRAADQQTLDYGDYTLVLYGNTYARTGWIVNDLVGGDVVWAQFAAANEYSAGTNIAIVGNQISFDGILPVANGGTNANTAAGAKTSLGFTTKYAENNTLLQPSSNVVTWVVTHGMASRDVTVQVFDNNSYAQVEVDVERTNTAAVTLSWVATANVAANSYRVVVVG